MCKRLPIVLIAGLLDIKVNNFGLVPIVAFMKSATNWIVYIILLTGISACNKPATLFTTISANESGINFNNKLIESPELNILQYEYMYNGGGVGVGDFNNDGLPDIYFTGNRVENKLYLNRGDMKFEDVTAISK